MGTIAILTRLNILLPEHVCFSIGLLSFLSGVFYNFQCTSLNNLVIILLYLFQNIFIFWMLYKWNCIVNFTFKLFIASV